MKKLAILTLTLLLTLTAVFAAEGTCPACGDETWQTVTSETWSAGGEVKSGHYRLTEHIDLTAALVIPAGETVCVDLNGYNLTQVAPGAGKSYVLRVFEVSGTLTILDATAREENGEYISGVISGGRCYAAETNSNTHGANIYCTDGSEFNLYSGKISGGTIRRRYHATNRFAGGNIFSRGTVNIYGGVIEKGRVYSDYVAGATTTGQRQVYVVGGNLAVSQGELNISGGVITGGIAENLAKAPAAPGLYDALGGNIYVNGATVTISGGIISGGIARCANQGADNATVTEVVSTARGGNLCYIGKGELLITGGTITGGSTEASVEAYPEATLTQKTFYSQGGNIYTCETANLRYKGGKNTDGTAYQGGCIFTWGIFHIDDGYFAGGIANPVEGLSDNRGGNIYGAKKTYIHGGLIEDGTASRGGNVFAGNYLTVAGGVIRNGVATNRGGNIGSAAGYLIIEDGEIYGGKGGESNFGSNIWCADDLFIYGGRITDPNGGSSITVMSNAECKVYGGTITGGLFAYDSTSTGCGDLYIYGGSIDYIRTGTAGTNIIQFFGGHIGGIVNSSGKTLTLEAIDDNRYGTPLYLPCTHLSREGGKYIFFHHFEGYCATCDHTYGSDACTLCRWVHTNLPGSHSYEKGICTTCGYKENGSQVAIVGSNYFDSLEDALLEGEATGKTVKLIKDLEIQNATLYSTLDLNGHILTVNGFLSAENKTATLLDSQITGGIRGKLYTHPENPCIPVPDGDLYRLEQVTLKQKTEKVTSDCVKLKFIIQNPAEETYLDTTDAYKVCIRVTWQEQGQEKFHLFRFTPELVQAYASQWGKKMFTCTITGLSELENWSVTAQVIAAEAVAAAEDITPPATTSVSLYQSGNGFQSPKTIPTWDALNALPQKYTGMSIDEARQAVVAFMDYAQTFTWTAADDQSYYISDSMGYHNLQKNYIYGGLPYVHLGSGNVYRFMDYMDPATGVLDVKNAMAEPMLFGNQCSLCVYYAFSRVINSVHTGAYTSYLNYKNGYIPIGPYTYTLERNQFIEGVWDTSDVCLENGEQVMFESYALALPADGMVSPGHAIMVTGTPHVVRNENGEIDAERSYIVYSDQTNGWGIGTNSQGDIYQYTRANFGHFSFAKLYADGYVPFTFAEFLGTDPIEETEVTYTHTGSTITWEQLIGSTVSSNYGVSDIYAIFTDSQGNEVYKLAMRARLSLVRELTFGIDVMVTGVNTTTQWGSLDKLSPTEDYTVQIVAQLTTGERPVLWEGAYLQ